MINKKMNIVFIIMLISIFTTSCSFKLLNLTTFTDDRMHSSFIAFNGVEDSVVTLEEGQKINIHTTFEISKGSISATVYHPNGETIVTTTADAKNDGTANFVEDEIIISVEEAGEYIIAVEGDWTSGSYNVFWYIRDEK